MNHKTAVLVKEKGNWSNRKGKPKGISTEIGARREI